MKKKKALIVSYWFPPNPTVASKRVKSYYDYLKLKSEWEVDVFCPNWSNQSSTDQNVIDPIKLNFTLNYIDIGRANENLFQKIKRLLIHDLLKIVVFLQFFRPSFYSKAKSEILKLNISKYDVVLTSYGPVDVFYLGYLIKKINPSIKWVADYRDHMSLNYTRDMGFWRFFVRLLEKRFLNKIDACLVVSKTMVSQLSKMYDGPISLVYNGFELVGSSETIEEVKTRFNIENEYLLYTGSIYAGKKDISGLFNFLNSNSQLSEKELIFATNTPEDQNYLETLSKNYPNLKLKVLIDVDSERIALLQKNASLLILVLSPEGFDREAIPVKFFEYLHAQKPIIYSGLTKECEVYDLIKTMKVGEHYSNFSSMEFNPKIEQINQYRRDVQSQKIVDLLNNLVPN